MMSKNVRCSECRHQMTGWDGGFFGEPMTCECRIYGVTEGRKGCSKFKKRVTKSDLLNKIQSLEQKVDEQQATIEAKDKEIEESKITIQLYEADVSMRDNFLKSKGLYDEFLQCTLE